MARHIQTNGFLVRSLGHPPNVAAPLMATDSAFLYRYMTRYALFVLASFTVGRKLYWIVLRGATSEQHTMCVCVYVCDFVCMYFVITYLYIWTGKPPPPSVYVCVGVYVWICDCVFVCNFAYISVVGCKGKARRIPHNKRVLFSASCKGNVMQAYVELVFPGSVYEQWTTSLAGE